MTMLLFTMMLMSITLTRSIVVTFCLTVLYIVAKGNSFYHNEFLNGKWLPE